MKYLIKLTLTFTFCMMISDVLAQSQIVTLEQLWNDAEKNSQLVKTKKTEYQVAEQKVESSKSGYLPDIQLDVSVGYLSDGILSDRNFKNTSRVENPHFMNDFALKANQLIYGGGTVKNAVLLSKTAQEMASLSYEKQLQDVRMMVAGYYLDLCKLYNQETVLDDNLKLCEIVIDNMKVMEREGTALSNDILRYELQKEHILLAKRKIKDALDIVCHKIATIVHWEGDARFIPDTTLFSNYFQMMDSESWRQAALKGNINLKMADTNLKMKEFEVKISKGDMLPKVALFAEYHLDGPITTEVPVIDKNFNYMFVGVGVQYSLSSLNKNKREVKVAKSNREKAADIKVLTEEEVNDNVYASYIDYLTSKAEVETQQKSVLLADKNYSVISSRYNNGLVTITDMLDAANVKLDAELELVNSNINLLYNYFKLKYISSSL